MIFIFNIFLYFSSFPAGNVSVCVASAFLFRQSVGCLYIKMLTGNKFMSATIATLSLLTVPIFISKSILDSELENSSSSYSATQ